MTKLPLNQVANTIRKEDNEKGFIPEDKVERAKYIEDIKNAFGYKKDEDNKEIKRKRWAKIKDLAGDDPEKIQKMKDILYTEEEKQDGVEQKESLEKSLEFEKDTFKIDSTGWKEPTEGKFAGKGVKVNPAGDVTEDLKTGEQLFIGYANFLGYVAADKGCTTQEVEKKYMMTRQEFEEKMKDMPNGSAEYKDFYNKNIEGHLAGYWHPRNKNFYEVGERSNVWLVDGNNAVFDADFWDQNGYHKSFGLSGRLLKN